MLSVKDLPAGLLEAARNHLGITWPDPAGDKKLAGILLRGMAYLDDIAGEPLDYTVESLHQGLLFDYAIYARAEALDEFQGNYIHELIKLQTRREVARYGGKKEADLS